ncbi:hypothetical protein OIU77_013992 [Salix suchowensis]|uniref:Uncharacterized protein n=1 Tax=Salix suchowensis TaxID=1278906 RepID=A0ABQ8ZWJ4_9ROSI|nr:hypothetical protein OIU77_013992 [Salix suchowensis]
MADCNSNSNSNSNENFYGSQDVEVRDKTHS